MTERQDKPDIPKIVATVGTTAPALVMRLGVSYLRMKRSARKASRTFVTELERDGIPPELARRLGEEYGSELSLRKLLDTRGGAIFQGLRSR